MNAGPWILSVDVGTTTTAAAIRVGGERRPLELDGGPSMPSSVLAPPTGPLVVGRAARSQATLEPERVEHNPKRRLGDPVLLLGDRGVEPTEAIAAILGHVRSAAEVVMGGTPPVQLALTHPARWGTARIALLVEAAARAGLPTPELVPEPVAAAAHLAADLTEPGATLAVYDLGGGTFDAAVVRRTDEGFVVSGPPGGDDAIGGELFDDLVVDELLASLPELAAQLRAGQERAWRQAGAGLRRSARSAREALSSSPSYSWYEGAPIDTEISLSVDRLEALLRPATEATVSALLDTIARAGLAPRGPQDVVMVGGCARAPMVPRLLTAATGAPPRTWGDPKAAVSLGALAALDQRAAPAPRRPTVPPTAAPPQPTPRAGSPTPPRPTTATPGPPPPAPAAAARQDGPSAWSPVRIGAFVAVLLLLLGVASAIVALLLG